MPTKIEKDAVTGTDTTGHEWDGIKELNTPLPKWWLYVFYASIAWSLVYFVLYPSWPTLTTHFGGTQGYWSRAEIRDQLNAQAAERAPFVNRINAAPLAEVRSNPELLNFAMAGGRAAFADNCAPCHGAGGGGLKGFPSLADDDWMWGGKIDDIHRTVSYGIRNANSESRTSQMPRFGTDGILTAAQIRDVTDFVLSLSGRSTDTAAVARGTPLYADNCASCHGEKGEGNLEFGAPRLSDGIWLYGGDRASIIQSITQARAGSMPAWTGRLDEPTIKMLSVYVHSLGGGK